MTGEQKTWDEINTKLGKVIDIVDSMAKSNADGPHRREKVFFKALLKEMRNRAVLLRSAMQADLPHEVLRDWLEWEGTVWAWGPIYMGQLQAMLAEPLCDVCGDPDCSVWAYNLPSPTPIFVWVCARCRRYLRGDALPQPGSR